MEHLPSMPRAKSMIDSGLRKIILSVVNGESPWPLVLLGSPGTGKTCAALCLLDHVRGGLYYSAADLARSMLVARDKALVVRWRQQTYTLNEVDLWRFVSRVPLFVLDEIGTRTSVSDHQYDAVKQTLDSRFGKPLVVISNMTMQALDALYDRRVTSRLSAGTVVQLDDTDRRLERGA